MDLWQIFAKVLSLDIIYEIHSACFIYFNYFYKDYKDIERVFLDKLVDVHVTWINVLCNVTHIFDVFVRFAWFVFLYLKPKGNTNRGNSWEDFRRDRLEKKKINFTSFPKSCSINTISCITRSRNFVGIWLNLNGLLSLTMFITYILHCFTYLIYLTWIINIQEVYFWFGKMVDVHVTWINVHVTWLPIHVFSTFLACY